MKDASLYAQRFVKDLNASIHSQTDLSKRPEMIEQLCTEIFAMEGASSSAEEGAALSWLSSRTLSRGFSDVHFPAGKVSSTMAYLKKAFKGSGSSVEEVKDLAGSNLEVELQQREKESD